MVDRAFEDYEALKRKHTARGNGQDGQATLGEWDAGEDDYSIPPRGWLLGNTFCRRFVSALLGAGSAGKTALRLAQALSLAIGRSLTGENVFRRARVLFVSLEDDRDELRRRVRAAMLHHGVEPAEVKGWLFLKAIKGPRIAEERDGRIVPGELEGMIRRAVESRQIDLVCLDPFIKAHALDENDNAAIDFVCTILADLADELDIAVDLPHHTRKGSAGAAGDSDAGRGASAFSAAGRLVYTLTAMTAEEAKDLGVPHEERRFFVRLDRAKVNLAPPAQTATWFKLIGVNLGNATPEYPKGDEVQTVEPWTPPETWQGITATIANKILDVIDAGLPDGTRYSNEPAASQERSAWRVVQAEVPALTERKCQDIIASWLKNDVLRKETHTDFTQRKGRSGLAVNAGKRPGSHPE